MKYNDIIWDWNGTLLNDTELSIKCINTLLKRRSLPLLSAEQYREVFGFPIREYYQRIGLDFEKEPFETLAVEYMELYQIRSLSCKLYEGAAETLALLKEKGVRHILLSASDTGYLSAQLACYPELAGMFSRIMGLDNIHAASKTALGRLLAAQEDLSSALAVGDTPHDAEVAKAMNVDCVLVACGHKDRKSLLACGVPVLESVRQLPEFFTKRIYE